MASLEGVALAEGGGDAAVTGGIVIVVELGSGDVVVRGVGVGVGFDLLSPTLTQTNALTTRVVAKKLVMMKTINKNLR